MSINGVIHYITFERIGCQKNRIEKDNGKGQIISDKVERDKMCTKERKIGEHACKAKR